MNKIIFIAGILSTFLLGGLFFVAGFFTATSSNKIQSNNNLKEETDPKTPSKHIQNTIDGVVSGVSNIIKGNSASHNNNVKVTTIDGGTIILEKPSIDITVDSLLKEILSKHRIDDSCSPELDSLIISKESYYNDVNLAKKYIVFVGYFKSDIADQLRQIFASKGYKAHVEKSRSVEADESFVFCGPFHTDKSCKTLLNWLISHNFSESRIIDISEQKDVEMLGDNLFRSTLPINQEITLSPEVQASLPQEIISNNEEENQDDQFTEDIDSSQFEDDTASVQDLEEEAPDIVIQDTEYADTENKISID